MHYINILKPYDSFVQNIDWNLSQINGNTLQ